MLAHDLGIGKNSRLYKRLVIDDESVTDVSVINETRLDPGALFVLAELREGASLQKVEAAIREEIDALVREGVSKEDLKRIRTQIRAGFLFQDESALEHALKLARFEALTPGGYRTLETVLPTYESLKPEELRQVAARYLVPQRSVCVHAAPSRSGGGKKGDAKTDQAKKPREKKKAAPVAKKPVKQVVGKKPATKRVAKSASKKTAAKPAAKPASAKKPGGTK